MADVWTPRRILEAFDPAMSTQAFRPVAGDISGLIDALGGQRGITRLIEHHLNKVLDQRKFALHWRERQWNARLIALHLAARKERNQQQQLSMF